MIAFQRAAVVLVPLIFSPFSSGSLHSIVTQKQMLAKQCGLCIAAATHNTCCSHYGELCYQIQPGEALLVFLVLVLHFYSCLCSCSSSCSFSYSSTYYYYCCYVFVWFFCLRPPEGTTSAFHTIRQNVLSSKREEHYALSGV